ncbi:MAG: type I secretion system permease/ATPase [Deltaproteobacteria bacterium]|nr:type I secretion system permease/ATPase [Deltaproteobacteria bacterium]
MAGFHLDQRLLRKFFKKDASELKSVLLACKGSFFSAWFFSLFINILMLTPTIYMLQIYDRVLQSRSVETLVMITIITVAMFFVMGGLQFVQSMVFIRVGSRLDNMLNRRIFHAVFKRSLVQPGFEAGQPISDLTALRQFLTGSGLIAFFDIPWVPIYLIVLFWMHPVLGIFAVVTAIVLFALAFANEYFTKKPLAEANKQAIISRNYADKNLRNADVIHAMGMEESLLARWLKQHLLFLSLQSTASERAAVLHNLSRVMRIMSQSLILGLGCYLAVKLEVSPGMMIAGSIIMGRALAPVDQLIASWKGFAAARSAYERLSELLDAVPATEQFMSLPAPKGHVSVEGVMSGPPGTQTAVLRGITFQVEPGEVVAVIGPSAAGKSTLAKVLLGIWPCMAGTVRLDGANIAQLNRDEIGSYIGYLPQDIELFDGTVAENVARFGPVVPEKVVEAAKRAGIHEMVLRLPKGYDTPIGPGGSVLSAGQRQRVALARAFYGDPVLIVLDEPNSNLDDQGELALAMGVRTMKDLGITMFLITHRPGILAQVDKILLMRDGQVLLYGPRDAVLAKLAGQPAQQPAQAAQAPAAPVKH